VERPAGEATVRQLVARGAVLILDRDEARGGTGKGARKAAAFAKTDVTSELEVQSATPRRSSGRCASP
jgi:NAD(P)-dependent dehydrogenase (short-subunit alcohol dehydrogenase family)